MGTADRTQDAVLEILILPDVINTGCVFHLKKQRVCKKISSRSDNEMKGDCSALGALSGIHRYSGRVLKNTLKHPTTNAYRWVNRNVKAM